MRRLLFGLVFGLVGGGLALPTVAGPETAEQEVVATWNNLALDAVRVTRASDADAARTYAILNIAVYDAVNGLLRANGPRTRAPALVPGPGPRPGNPQAAAAAAAHGVLASLILTAGPPTTPSSPPTLPAYAPATGGIWGCAGDTRSLSRC